MYKYLTLLVASLFFLQCKGQEKKDDIIIVAQPIMEKDATNSIKILFKNLSKQDSIFIGEHKNIDLNENPTKSQIEINGENYLEYYTYIIPTKEGALKLPEIKGITKNKTITSKSRVITIVNEIPKATSNNILLKLISNKAKYNLNDTIKIELYEYSQFYNTTKITFKKDSIMALSKTKGINGALQMQKENDLYQITGVENLEGYIEERFDVLNFNWDPFRERSITEKIDGELYIKTLLFSADIKAKKKGDFKINPSKFKYTVFKSESDYLDSFVKNEKGTYSKKTSENKVLIISKELIFKVK